MRQPMSKITGTFDTFGGRAILYEATWEAAGNGAIWKGIMSGANGILLGSPGGVIFSAKQHDIATQIRAKMEMAIKRSGLH